MENQIEIPCHLIHCYGGEGCFFPGGDAVSPSYSSAFPWCLTSAHSMNAVQDGICHSIPPPVPPSYMTDQYNRRNFSDLQFPYHGGIIGVPQSNLPGVASSVHGGSERFPQAQGSALSTLFGTIHAEIGKMTAQEIMDAKALAASKSHSEAERRRRERINGHLAKLRSMLPNTTKTDKASLLAEVIQHVKELKRQTSEIAEESPLPTEADELIVSTTCDEDGKFIVRASLCCEDRTDLLPDLINALKALKLRTLKAEITTVAGRVKNVLLITGENSSNEDDRQQSITAIEDALKAVVEQTAKHDPSPSSAGGTKRQRTNSLPGTVIV